MKDSQKIVLALILGVVLAYSAASTLGAAAQYWVHTQNCVATATVGCKLAYGVLAFMGALGMLVLPLLALLLAGLSYALMGSRSTDGVQRPAGISAAAIYLGWTAVVGLLLFILYRLPTQPSVSVVATGAMQWLGALLSMAALVGAVLLWRMRPAGWMVALGYLALSLCLGVLSFRPATGLAIALLIPLAAKVALLVYLLTPAVRRLLAPR